MTFCTSCGAENADGTQFCVRCGTSLPPTAPGSWGASGDPGNRASGGLNDPAMGYTPPAYTPQGTPSGALFSQPAGGVPMGQMNYAVWADRVVAALIDGGIVLGGMIVLYIVIAIIGAIFGGLGAAISGVTGDQGGAALAGGLLSWGFCCIAFVLMPIVSLGIGLYNKVHLVSKRGYSIGQGVMQLKVVTAQGDLVPVGTLVLRLLVQIGFSIIPFLPLLSILWPLWDPQRQALHDKAVGTFVVKTV